MLDRTRGRMDLLHQDVGAVFLLDPEPARDPGLEIDPDAIEFALGAGMQPFPHREEDVAGPEEGFLGGRAAERGPQPEHRV